ncbi:hypothetical protein H0H87_008535 [Tephrocybe sp. NHM501043]|nr:hypothetical protein H0H87_008535 [Tephrocybe sp. NHM501043]
MELEIGNAETHTSDLELPANSMHICKVVNLTASSPTPEDTEMTYEEVQSSSPIEYGAEDENQMDTYIEKIAQKAKAFEKASKLLLDPSFCLQHD